MMARYKGGGEFEFFHVITAIFKMHCRTSEVGATHLMVSLTPADAPAHVTQGHAGVRAGVVDLLTNVLAVLVGVITFEHRAVTGSCHGQSSSFTAGCTYTISPLSAGLPGWKAAVLVSLHGLEAIRSALTVSPIVDIFVPAFYIATIVFGAVGCSAVDYYCSRWLTASW